MEDSKNNNKNHFTRRSILPLLGGSLLLPFLGFGKDSEEVLDESEEFETLLKPDGTTVRIKKSVYNNAKVIEKNVSNKSLLEWLKK